MPRGTRALRDTAGTPGDSFTAFIRADRLIAVCWCQTQYVRIPALDVCRGNTASCGMPTCFPPDGREPASGEIVKANGGSWKSQTGTSTSDPSYAESDDRIHDKRILQRAGRLPPVKLVARRNRVQEMYGANMHVLDIALALDVPTHIVQNDLGWLSRHGKIQRRRNQPRKRRSSA